MKKFQVSGFGFLVSRKAKLFLLFLILPFTLWSQSFPEQPNPPRLVNDFTNTLAQEENNILEQKLVAFSDTTSTQIAIVIMHSIGEYEISDYTYQLGRKWGIGKKGKNNGALILVALDDHKAWIATGYGLEGVIPDALAKRIIDQDITPAFKQGNYFGGLDKATDTMIKLASGEYTADDVGSSNLPVANYFPFIIFILIAFFIFFTKYRSARSYAHINGMSFWAAWMLLNAATRSSRGSWGGFSGGSGWGGGGGGGGFGGFGGGSFGGGGAGGSW